MWNIMYGIIQRNDPYSKAISACEPWTINQLTYNILYK